MKYSIKVNEVRAKEGSNIKGFATVVFGDSFKITNIAILENKDKSNTYDSYDDGYDDIYMDGDYDYDRYDRDSDYADGVDDAMDEFDEDW